MSQPNEPTHFYFTAQTTVISWEPSVSPSNYYRYKLPAACLARVELEVSAWDEVGPPSYSKEFLSWLGRSDVSHGGGV